jgi:hypothetical protein
MVWSIFLMNAFGVILQNRSNLGNILEGFIALAMMLVLEPLWLQLFGTTPGKAIFGLQLKTAEGEKLTYKRAFERTWGVIGAGMGFGIPIYNLIRLWKSYKLCSEWQRQPWEDEVVYTIKDTKRYRGVLFLGAHAIIIGILVVAQAIQQLPPNRGDLTVAEFAENYNYYTKLFDLDFNKYLDSNGQWAEKPFDGGISIEIGRSEMPTYNYTLENGYITGVSFAIELENSDEWFKAYDVEMFLASLAFAGAQNEVTLFSKVPSRIGRGIENRFFGGFEFVEAGIAFVCTTEYSGYIETQSNLLVPDKNAKDNYFRLQFTMEKLE